MIKVIVAGVRTLNYYGFLKRKLNYYLANLLPNLKIISGTARGTDKLGEKFAREGNIKIIQCPAKWEKYGKKAGYLRNKEMANLATHCILFWDYKSKGTGHMYTIAKNKGLLIRTIDLRSVYLMEYIHIKDSKGKYNCWEVVDYREKEKCYEIRLLVDRSYISMIGHDKIWKENGKYFSDFVKDFNLKETFAFTAFGKIMI